MGLCPSRKCPTDSAEEADKKDLVYFVKDVVAELEQDKRAHYGPANKAELYEDDKKLAIVRAEPNIQLFLEHRVNGVVASDGKIQAVIAQKVRAGRFDLATMDIAMGSLDGVDTISVLRNEIDVRIVTISAHLTDAIRTDLYDREVRHFVEKPFTPKEILSVIRQALGEA